jgi:cytochrome c oxidase cbb3-type subunit 1
VPFADVTAALAPWHAATSVALGLLLIGHIAFCINFAWIACPVNSRGTAGAEIAPPPAMSLATKEGHA